MEVLTVHPNLTESIYDILGPEDSFGVAQVCHRNNYLQLLFYQMLLLHTSGAKRHSIPVDYQSTDCQFLV